MRKFALLFVWALAPVAWAAAPGVVGELEQSSTTSPKEKVEFTRSAMEEMAASVKEVENLLEKAQREKNEEQIDCLTRKLTPMRSLVDISRQSNTLMQQALASNDAVHADQEFRKIAVALAKTREFLAEAKACVGSSSGDKAKSVATYSQTTQDLADGSTLDDADLVTPLEINPGTAY